MKLFLFLLRRSWRGVAATLVVGLISGATSAALIAVINMALTAPPERRHELAGDFLTLAVLFPLAWLASQYLIVRLGQDVILSLRKELSQRVLEAPLRRLEEIGAHRVLAAMTDDLLNITTLISSFPNLIVNATTLAGCLAYLVWLSPVQFLPFSLVLLLGTLSYRWALTAGRDRVREARSRSDELFRHYRGLTDGVKELKLHGPRRTAFLERLNATAEAMRDLGVSATMIFNAAGTWGRSLFFVAIGLLFFVLPRWVEVSRGELTAYTLALLYMRTPLQGLLDLFPQLSRVDVALERVRKLGISLESERRPASPPPPSAAASWKRIELAGVTYSYGRAGSDRRFTVGPIDLTLEPGEILFLVGGNGSGKTTLAKLLLGLYTPDTGEVRLNGRPVGEADRELYRSHFTAVFSDFYLFDRLLGLEGFRMNERAREYLAQLGLDHKVRIERGMFSTTELSQGQRKRLALLVAYLEDRPVYLFDEWAADQDPAFKKVFYFQLLPELKNRGKAVVVISHDDHYYGVADRIVKLDEGKVDEELPEAALVTRSAAP